jgi:hypothetical protein
LDEFVSSKSGARSSSQQEEKKDEEKELTPTHRLISLLGMIGSRNFLLALRLSKGTTGKFPYNKEGVLDVKASDYLKNAVAIEEYCQRNGIDYNETAYAAAYLYDWLLALARQKNIPKNAEAYALQAYKYSLRIGVLSYGLAEKVRGFGFMKFALAAGLTTGLGKVVMACEYTSKTRSFLDYQAELEKKPISHPVAAMISEREKFLVNHAEISALCLRFSGIFSFFERSVNYYEEPFFLKNGDKNHYQLAVILYTAAQMARDWKLPADTKDPVFNNWRNPWLKDLRITDNHLLETIRWAMKLS